MKESGSPRVRKLMAIRLTRFRKAAEGCDCSWHELSFIMFALHICFEPAYRKCHSQVVCFTQIAT
ncbi:Uncharacterized protein DAT39_013056 [Clarias magur]|uniref:Uncharacterized protein n=1 Tax=Clarias magur TaxID=1594786 RepID=A0A8J4TXG5_CLAMG|nr:Uncharacterized protein DAT39_013056 [Clarias magur]